MPTSKSKYQLSMAGEYGVCSELSKRGFDVSLTMGNAKSVDIYVHLAKPSYKRIEVKTSNTSKIVTGFFQKYFKSGSTDTPDIWILVHIDKSYKSRYFILTHQEMGKLQMARNKLTSWPLAKIKGVDNVLLSDLDKSGYENQWNKI